MRLDAEMLRKLLPNTSVICLEEVDSTSNEAKRMAVGGCGASVLVVSESQSGGRGRMGRSFFSAAGGIYMTYMRRVDVGVGDVVCVTTAAAAVVAEALCRHCGGDFCIKWVNDIYLGGRKVCGILSESVSGADGALYVLVGIGINMGDMKFPYELGDIAASAGACERPEELVRDIVCGLESFFCAPQGREYMNVYRKKFMLAGKVVRVLGGCEEICGEVLGVDDDGALLLLPEGSGEAVRIISGEVSVRLI